MAEVYKIVKGDGAGGFMNPPGDPAHTYRIESYSSSRSNARVAGIYSIDSAQEWMPQHIRKTAAEMVANATRTPSELWVRSVYGYFRNMWTVDGQPWANVNQLVSGRPKGAPIEYSAAVVHVRRWFPDHAARADLITDPGKGYGNYPCDMCGQRVQYKASVDALAVAATGDVHCPKGGKHSVDGIS